MTRILERERKKPHILRQADLPRDDELWICGCGLSATYPLCDNTHEAIAKEPKEGVFRYARRSGDLMRAPVRVEVEGPEEPVGAAKP